MSPELSFPERLTVLGGPRTLEVDPGEYDTYAGNACLWLSAFIGYAELRGMRGQRQPTFVDARRNSFRASKFYDWHREAVAAVQPFLEAVRNKTERELRERRRRVQNDHLARAARELRTICGRQLLSAEGRAQPPATQGTFFASYRDPRRLQEPGRAHHAATVAAVPDWRAMVDRARHDAMAEFWPRSRSY